MAAFSAPQFLREKGGFATTVSKVISRSSSTSVGRLRVSHHSMRAASFACRNMFMRANAQVAPLTSWPWSEKSLDPTSSAARMSSEPEPHAGSQILAPCFGAASLASSRETAAGV